MTLHQFALAVLMSGHLFALEVSWQSASDATNVQSDGTTALDSTFQFEIGQFINGFVPTPDNTTSWQLNWQSFGTTIYDATRSRIRGTGDLADNSTFAAGSPIFLWGYDSKSDNDAQWILLSADDWEWPAVQPLAFGTTIAVSDADQPHEQILGRLNGDNSLMQMESAFAQTFDEWTRFRFSAAQRAQIPSIAGANDDADADGQPNYIEYLAGSDPLAFSDDLLRIALGSNNSCVTLTYRYNHRAAEQIVVRSATGLDGTFTEIPAECLASGVVGYTSITIEVAITNSRTFYRLEASSVD